MIGFHCGRRLISMRENWTSFTKRCIICDRRFTQRKRQPRKRAQRGRFPFRVRT